MGVFLFAGETKPGTDGKEKGIIPFRNGNNEFVAGDKLMNILDIISLVSADT
jgi:hypothetical protein